MIRRDIDGLLVWLSAEDEAKKKPALILDYDGTYYSVFYCTTAGKQLNIYKYERLGDALQQFEMHLPANEKSVGQ